MQRFEIIEGTSAKFWEISKTTDLAFTVRFGRLGTDGSISEKTFGSSAERDRQHDKLVSEKIKKGYQPVVAGAEKPAAVDAIAPTAKEKLAPRAEAPTAPLAGKLRVADFDAEDEASFSLTPGTSWTLRVGDADFAFAPAALMDAAGVVYPSQAQLLGRHPVDGDGEPTSDGKYLPAFLFPRTQLDELLKTGTTRVFGPWIAAPVPVEVEKRATCKVTIAGKLTELPVFVIVGEDVKLKVLCSTALPLILDREEAGDCRLAITELSEAPPTDDALKPVLKALTKAARAAEKQFDSLTGKARVAALFARLATSEHSFAARQELIALPASEDVTPAALEGLGDAVVALPRDGLSKAQQNAVRRSFNTLYVLAQRPHAAGHAVLRQLAERMMELPKSALDAAKALAFRKSPEDAEWLAVIVRRYRDLGRFDDAIAIASSGNRLYDGFVDLFTAEALTSPNGVENAVKVLESLTVPIDPRWPALVAAHLYQHWAFLGAFSLAVMKGTADEATSAALLLLETMRGHERAPGDLHEAIGDAPALAVDAWLANALNDPAVFPWSEIHRVLVGAGGHDPALLARIGARIG